eukprot:TRINITY_DN6012_c0_g3_i1.p3 TRINITY_DN6012_c0_g3~~TRINITY_DN6012_c0_g3_i1.p3  ORF type:complete len:130 (+),score=12.92 TRINITY_DN6012_c0_g3_i1:727-1116(+)
MGEFVDGDVSAVLQPREIHELHRELSYLAPQLKDSCHLLQQVAVGVALEDVDALALRHDVIVLCEELLYFVEAAALEKAVDELVGEGLDYPGRTLYQSIAHIAIEFIVRAVFGRFELISANLLHNCFIT